LRNFLLSLAVLAVLLPLLEGGVRLAAPPGVDVPHLRVSAHGFYTWQPGARFTYHNLPEVVPATAEVRVNEEGLRGPSFPRAKPAGERRILVLGDSYTAAVQLPEEQIYPTLLQRRLDERGTSGTWRVVNAGVNGAGTAHELLYYRYRGAALAPGVVVLEFVFNDLEDNVRHGGFEVRDGRAVLADALADPPFWKPPLLAARDFLGNRSLAFYLSYKALRDALGGSGIAAVAHADAPPVVAEPPADDAAFALFEALLAELVDRTVAAGTPLIVLVIPWPMHVSGAVPPYDRVKDILRARVPEPSRRLVIMDAAFQRALAGGQPVYLAHDGHLDESGHRLVADELARAIAELPAH
jgi:lysophospholipase L1-like esterase